MPSNVEQGGILEIRKWRDDITEIIELLLGKGAQGIIFGKARLLMMEVIRDERLLFRDGSSAEFVSLGKAVAGQWPAPLPSSSASGEQARTPNFQGQPEQQDLARKTARRYLFVFFSRRR